MPPAAAADGGKSARSPSNGAARRDVPVRRAATTEASCNAARVLVVEDHPLMIDGICLCLEAEGYEVAAAPLESRESVLEKAAHLRPDVVLLDLELGEAVGDAAALVVPLVRLGATVVVVSGSSEAARIGALVEKGAAGFVPKTCSFDAVVGAVAAAVARRPLMSEEERRHLRAELRAAQRRNGALERLSPREAEILTDLVDPAALRQDSAPRLHIGATAVETGAARIFRNDEITVDALLASACLPMLFPAVEIDGIAYWDGAYSGNPPTVPLLADGPRDLVLTRAQSTMRRGVPTKPADIVSRIEEIAFQSVVEAELAHLPASVGLTEYSANATLSGLPPESRAKADRGFIETLFDAGRSAVALAEVA